MFTFEIYSSNGAKHKFEHIERVEYNFSGLQVLSGEDILNHRYLTICDLHLYSSNAAYTISEKEISIIEVNKES